MKKNINIVALSLGAGGAEKVISLLLTKLVEDFNVNLILFNDIKHFDIPNNVSVFILDVSNKNTSFIYKTTSFLKIINEYKIVLSKTKPNFSVSFLPRPNFLNTYVKYPCSKIIISERAFPSLGYKSNIFVYNLYKILFRILYNKADGIFSNSVYINNDLKNNFKIKRPMEVIYNPVLIPPRSEFMKIELKQNDIVWVGKLNQVKNPELLINSLTHTEKTYKVEMLGEGEKKTDLIKMANMLDVKFIGKVNNVNDFIINSRCLVLTSNSEGFPNVILEGMAYGLPIISTNCLSGPLELLNNNEPVVIEKGSYAIGKFGVLVNVNDEIGLAKAIDRLLNDKPLYDYLSEMSLNRVQSFSLSSFYFKFLRFIGN